MRGLRRKAYATRKGYLKSCDEKQWLLYSDKELTLQSMGGDYEELVQINIQLAGDHVRLKDDYVLGSTLCDSTRYVRSNTLGVFC